MEALHILCMTIAILLERSVAKINQNTVCILCGNRLFIVWLNNFDSQMTGQKIGLFNQISRTNSGVGGQPFQLTVEVTCE